MRRFMVLASLAPALALTACAGYENTTRDAVVGGALGAAAGAVIGNNTGSGDAATGAAIGAVVGAAGGAAVGCQRDNVCPWSQNNDRHSELYYDPRANRYYYTNRGDGCTYWRNGEFRGC